MRGEKIREEGTTGFTLQRIPLLKISLPIYVFLSGHPLLPSPTILYNKMQYLINAAQEQSFVYRTSSFSSASPPSKPSAMGCKERF